MFLINEAPNNESLITNFQVFLYSNIDKFTFTKAVQKSLLWCSTLKLWPLLRNMSKQLYKINFPHEFQFVCKEARRIEGITSPMICSTGHGEHYFAYFESAFISFRKHLWFIFLILLYNDLSVPATLRAVPSKYFNRGSWSLLRNALVYADY